MLGQIFEFLFHVRKKLFFGARFFKNLQKLSMGTPIVSCRHPPGFGSLFWRFFTIFHGFSLGKMFFQALRTYIDAKFHGESISDGFRAIRDRKVGQKLKIPNKNHQTRKSGHPPPKSLSIIPGCHCRLHCRFIRPGRQVQTQLFTGLVEQGLVKLRV